MATLRSGLTCRGARPLLFMRWPRTYQADEGALIPGGNLGNRSLLTFHVKYRIQGLTLRVQPQAAMKPMEETSPLIPVSPLQRPKSLNDLAYENLKEGILSGRLVAGRIYSELELARGLGISRTPVREALLRLAAENLIVFHPRKGMSINYFSREDIENLFELREAIEEKAVAKVTGHLSKEEIQKLREILKEQEECLRDDFDESLFLEADKRFHLFLIEASGNRFMVQTYNSIRDYITIPAREALTKKGRAMEVIQEHRAIVKALAEANMASVRETVRKHLINSKRMALEGHDEQKERGS